MLDQINENKFISSLVQNLVRSPQQLNNTHQSDSELIRLKMDSENILAITMDSVAEEIETGLYADPYLAGWMTVIVNFSDLAAVGAKPIGLLTSLVLPADYSHEALYQLQCGIRDACEGLNTFLLGGDINTGTELILTGCAAGIVDGQKIITRTGIKPNDLVYASGYMGSGNAFALTKLFQLQNNNYEYKPFARINEGQLIKKYASACMDTSDGLISTLDQLMRLNRKGFRIESEVEKLISPRSHDIFNECKIPPWLSLAGLHGEFELVFTLPELSENQFLREADSIGWSPLKLGKVIENPSIQLPVYGKQAVIDSKKIRNLASEPDFNIYNYLKSMLEIDEKLRE